MSTVGLEPRATCVGGLYLNRSAISTILKNLAAAGFEPKQDGYRASVLPVNQIGRSEKYAQTGDRTHDLIDANRAL